MKDERNEVEEHKHPKIDLAHLLSYIFIFFVVPPLVYATGRWIDDFFFLPRFPQFPLNLIAGFGVFLFGLRVGIGATRQLYTQGRGLPWGEVDTKSQTKALVTDGLYAHIRNPMVVGYSLLPCGMGLMFQSLGMALPIAMATFAIAVFWTKIREEAHLAEKFGKAYQEYKQRTPFVIPHIKRSDIPPVANMSISLLGLYLLSLLTLGVSNAPSNVFQKTLVGTLFIIICGIGAIAGISPSRCSQLLHLSSKAHSDNLISIHREGLEGETTSIRGHHPTCGSFESHVFQFRHRTYCTGCTALTVGAAAASGGTILFFLTNISIGSVWGYISFWTGFVGVSLGLLQYIWFVESAPLHFSVDVFFVIGTSLLLLGVDSINGAVTLEAYLLILIPYLIITRIGLSKWEHMKKCAGCKSHGCRFAKEID